MSVIKNKRKLSEMEFLDNAKKLHKEIISLCMRCPKRWDRFMTQDIAHLANSMIIHIKRGNSIYPTNRSEVQLRRNEFISGIADLQGLISLMDNMFDYCRENTEFQIKPSRMESIMLMIDNEIKLIRGLMRKDAARYKNIAFDTQGT